MMGFVVHDVIVVTSFSEEAAAKARRKAVAIFGRDLVTKMARSPINGYRTFVVLPDGSKVGWPDREDYQSRRYSFVSWLTAGRGEPPQSYLEWASLRYGDDLGRPVVTDHKSKRRK